MEELKKLKGVLSDNIFKNVKGLLESYAYYKCDFLCMNFNAWEKLFTRIAWRLHKKNVSSNLFTAELVACVNSTIGNFIKQKLYEGKTYILDNLLVKLEKSGYKKERLLAMFLLELKCLNVEFTEYFFNLLKRNSQKFNLLISMLGFKDLSYEEFISILNKNHKLDIEIIKFSDIDYNRLAYKYSNMSFEQIRNLFGDDFYTLSLNNRNLLKRYFLPIVDDNCWHVLYDAMKEVNLLLWGYKRKSLGLDISILKQTYLNNKSNFSEEQALYLECLVFGMQDKMVFYSKYPHSRIKTCELINILEKMYFDIDLLFLKSSDSLTKEQYLKVLDMYPNELSDMEKDVLNYYYEIEPVLSLDELCKKYDKTNYQLRGLIKQIKKRCLSLYCNLNKEQRIDKDIYLPYVLDMRYNLNPDARKALKMYLVDNMTYDEISKVFNKEAYKLIFIGLEKIDAYRFGIDKLNDDTEVFDVTITDDDITEEINKPQIESVLTDKEKEILSYYYGFKNNYNLEGKKLIGKELREALGLKKHHSEKLKAAINKIKKRKSGLLTPEYLYIPKDKLADILQNSHLPISIQDRDIICYLLGLNEHPYKSFLELATMYGVKEAAIRRKYQVAIVNINKYLLGEKEGIINYELDIIPNLRYFHPRDRRMIIDYYRDNLTIKDIAKKYNLTIGLVTYRMFKLKTKIYEYVKNPNAKKFDFDYYYEVVNEPNFPFRGDLELAKKIFDLYAGEKANAEEIQEILGLNINTLTILKIVENLAMAVFKYQMGIRKENAFSVQEVRDFYENNKDRFTPEEITLFKRFFNKSFGIDIKMSEDLTYLLLKAKNSKCYNVLSSDKLLTLKILKKFKKQLSKSSIATLMFYGNISEREFMSGSEINHVFRLLNVLDRNLAVQDSVNRVRKIS